MPQNRFYGVLAGWTGVCGGLGLKRPRKASEAGRSLRSVRRLVCFKPSGGTRSSGGPQATGVGGRAERSPRPVPYSAADFSSGGTLWGAF